jgi:hypothetical protein
MFYCFTAEMADNNNYVKDIVSKDALSDQLKSGQ